MRKTLLIAAAALAGSIISSQAQVYSQNVVGYYNLTMPSTGYNFVSVQFNVGVSNGASECFPTVPDGTEFLAWSPNNSKFVINYYDTGGGSTPPFQSWYMSDYATSTNQPVFAPGTSVFIVPSSSVTNAVVGSVISAFTNNMIAGYNMAASALPLGGAATNTLFNLNSLPDGTETLQWDFTHQTYVINYYDTGGGSTTPGNSWYMSDYATSTNPPALSVGEGTFIVPPSPFAYSQTYTNN